MEHKPLSLLDHAAAFMNCQYLSDLSLLTPYQRCLLAGYFDHVEPKDYTLFEWNDALSYLTGFGPEETEEAAKCQLQMMLRRLPWD